MSNGLKLKLGLINIEKSDNRVYYQMNKEAVNYLLEVTKNKLLEDKNEV